MKKKTLVMLCTSIVCGALSLCTTITHAGPATRTLLIQDMALGQLTDPNMLAKYYTSYVTTEFEVNATPMANIDLVNPSFSSPFVDDLYVTNGVITIDLAAAAPLQSELRGITITLTPNVNGSLIENWSCSTSSTLEVTLLGTAYNMATLMAWPLSLCTT